MGALCSMSGLEGEIVRSLLSVLEGGVLPSAMSRLEGGSDCSFYVWVSGL